MTDGKMEAVTRREILAKGIGVLATVSLTAVAATSSEGQTQPKKMAQKLVQYQQTPKKDQKCSTCLQFVPPDSCKLVEGKINPEGWCSLFAPKPKK